MIIGHNIRTSGYDLTDVPDIAKQNSANIYQIFLSSPQQFSTKTHDKKYLEIIKQKNISNNIQCVVHGSYLINFCRDPTDKIFINGCKILISDLNSSVHLGAIGVIIHMGKNVNKTSFDTAFSNYVNGIKYVLKHSDTKSTIILETGAGQGTEICTSLVKLGMIRDTLTEQERTRVKFCLDTCHMFAAGYDLTDSSYINMLSEHIQATLKWENIVVIHLNDSKDKVNSKLDRHETFDRGKIQTGIFDFIKIVNSKKIPLVLETPEYDDYSYKSQIEYIANNI